MARVVTNLHDLASFQIKRCANRMSKNVLTSLEDIQMDQKIRINRFLSKLDPQLRDEAMAAFVLSDDKMQHLRKRVLDNSNDFVRELQADMQNYDINLKF